MSTLLRLNDIPNIMADGYLCDERRSLLFLSVWGRDTAIQELLGRLTLKNDEGLPQLTLTDEALHEHLLFPGNTDNLDKRTTRHQHTRFGTLIHLWLFDKRCLHPDRANGQAFLLLRRDEPCWHNRAWTLLKETTSLPLLDHWQGRVLGFLEASQMLTALSGKGALTGRQLTLDLPALTGFISDTIRAGELCITGNTAALQPYSRVA
ncbi:hypothetical protein RHD99_13550 [Buttiauxella selenatireducens]|uniref:DUF4123 domain-containing protein n=1 Tax=Buttiauxella selenatireducens TaxID=3073902 RepID=A0ABY9S4T7_9ENTR|nr:hypothetical protein [Buttiauxella sp. R73]WMY72511.1 hypothetical protein RHD99_13550 [Buttiauxella sp. R73]